MWAFTLTFLGDRRGWISNGSWDRETLLIAFNERFTHRLLIHRILSFEVISGSLWILSWSIMFKWGRKETVIRGRWVQNFTNIETFMIFPLCFRLFELFIKMWLTIRDVVHVKNLFEEISTIHDRLGLHCWVTTRTLTFLLFGFLVHFCICFIIYIEDYWNIVYCKIMEVLLGGRDVKLKEVQFLVLEYFDGV
jgi:hypothetical protein